MNVFLKKPFSVSEVAGVVNKLKLGKAGGLDGSLPEHFKYGGIEVIRILTILFNTVTNEEYIPHNFRRSLDVPVFKGGSKDPKERDSYRKIPLVSILSKIYEMAIAGRTSHWFTTDRLHILQGAAHKGSSSLCTSLVLQESIAYMRDRGSEVMVASLDTRKAYDTVWIEGLFYKLFNNGLNRKLWRILKEWYTNSEGIVSISGVASRSYRIRQGLRQGGVLSMNLYQLYISDLLYKLQKSGCGTYHDNMYYGCPCYMDDLLLISTYPAALKTMLDLTFEYANKWRYSFNVKKSVILPSVRRNTVLQVESVNSGIPIISEFVHVGIPISSSGMITTPSVESRLSKGRRSFFAMSGFGGDLKVPLVSI